MDFSHCELIPIKISDIAFVSVCAKLPKFLLCISSSNSALSHYPYQTFPSALQPFEEYRSIYNYIILVCSPLLSCNAMFCNYLSRVIKKQISIRIDNANDISDWCRRKVKVNISIFRRIVATVIYGGFQFELRKYFNVGGVVACLPRKPTNFLRCNIA